MRLLDESGILGVVKYLQDLCLVIKKYDFISARLDALMIAVDALLESWRDIVNCSIMKDGSDQLEEIFVTLREDYPEQFQVYKDIPNIVRHEKKNRLAKAALKASQGLAGEGL